MATETTKLAFVEGAAAATPAASRAVIYAKADGLMYSKDDAGVETLMSSGSASGIPASIFDAQGDLIVASAADTAARLALGASGTVLRSNGTTAAWATGLPIVATATQHNITSTTGTEVTLTPTPVLGAGTYMFIAHLLLQTAVTTNGPRVGINHTGTVTTFHAVFHYEDNAVTASVGAMATPGGLPFGHIHGSGSTATLSTTAPNMGPDTIQIINTNVLALIQGVMIVTVSGDFELWHGCESGASETRVMAGSSVVIHQTA
jgi:hypothetical protein